MTRFRTQVTATLSVRDWARAMDYYERAFGAKELYRVPGGGVGQLDIGGSRFWVAEESPEHLNFSPQTLGGCSVRMLLLVEDRQTHRLNLPLLLANRCDRGLWPRVSQVCVQRLESCSPA